MVPDAYSEGFWDDSMEEFVIGKKEEKDRCQCADEDDK